jgi:putative transposase
VKTHRSHYPVSWMCSALKLTAAAYYRWERGPECRRRREERMLLPRIRASWEASDRTYGSPRIRKDLRAEQIVCGKDRVARIMRENGIKSIPKKRFRYTTDSDHTLPVARNVLERKFEQKAINRSWVADITYIPTEEGWLYLAVLMDLCSRKIVGWSTSGRINRELTLSALERALLLRRPKPGMIHHSDRGSQYAAYEYQKALKKARAICSMSRKGDCYDNAAMESFFSSLKRERVHRRKYWTREEAKEDLQDYIERFYNRTRRHSFLGDVSPTEFENRLNLT